MKAHSDNWLEHSVHLFPFQSAPVNTKLSIMSPWPTSIKYKSALA